MTVGVVLAGHGSVTVGPGVVASDVCAPTATDTRTAVVDLDAWPGRPMIRPLGAANNFSCTIPVGRPPGPNVSTCGSVRLIDAGETFVHVALTHAVAPAAASKTKPFGKVIVTVGATAPTLNCVVIASRSPKAY